MIIGALSEVGVCEKDWNSWPVPIYPSVLLFSFAE